MSSAEIPPGPRRLLLARETEQLGRIAERIQKGRRVLAFLVCERAHRGEVIAWLSKATGRDLACPVESSAAELFAQLGSAAGGRPEEIVSLAWPPGDRGAIAALNLHREKLRRGASVLVWCAPEDLEVLRIEGQDATSFRDTWIFISGFSIPAVHVPSDVTPEIRLARARLDLPGDVPEAEGLLALARGEIHDAEGLFLRAAEDAARRDEDNRALLLRVVDCLVAQGEISCASALLLALQNACSSDEDRLYYIWQGAHAAALTGQVGLVRAILQDEYQAPLFADGVVYKNCATLVSVVRDGFDTRRLGVDDVAGTASYLGAVEGRFPPPEAGVPPFYRVLFPGLRADLLLMIPERRAEATDLARGALDLARVEVPAYAPEQAARLVRYLLLLDRFDDALDALSIAEREAESLEHLRALSTLRKLRVVAHVRRADGASTVDAAMAALRETLEATGSHRITSECLLVLARSLPPGCTHPDVLALLEEPAERFAEMPMLAQEELCREIRGDVLLARGRREEAAVCFAGAAKRLQHYGLLLRVPWLEAKRDAALGS